MTRQFSGRSTQAKFVNDRTRILEADRHGLPAVLTGRSPVRSWMIFGSYAAFPKA